MRDDFVIFEGSYMRGTLRSTSRKLLLLGMPGSGKSTVADEIRKYVESKPDWCVSYKNDYEILSQMYREQNSYSQAKRIEPAPYGGFTVLNLTVYDEALLELKQQIEELVLEPAEEENRLIIMEFARSSYKDAFEILGADFLKDAWFIFLDADIEECAKRVTARTHKHKDDKSPNDYFVSYKVFERYQQSKNSLYFHDEFQRRNGIPNKQLAIIENSHPMEESSSEIFQLVDRMLARQMPVLITP